MSLFVMSCPFRQPPGARSAPAGVAGDVSCTKMLRSWAWIRGLLLRWPGPPSCGIDDILGHATQRTFQCEQGIGRRRLAARLTPEHAPAVPADDQRRAGADPTGRHLPFDFAFAPGVGF